MPNIEYAQPHHRGVTSIMGVGETDLEPSNEEKYLKTAQWIALGTWGVGILIGSGLLKKAGFGASVATFLMGYLAEEKKKKVAAELDAAAAEAQAILEAPAEPQAQGNYIWR